MRGLKPETHEEYCDRWQHNLVLDRRHDLLRTVPIASDEITALDKFLASNPRTSTRDLIEIIYRVQFVQWMIFEEHPDDPVMRVKMLCQVYRQWEEFMTLSEEKRKIMEDPFLLWKAVLAEEEMADA
jgi:hypothetical protein